MPSFLDRLSRAYAAFTGREMRNVPLPFEGAYNQVGMPPLFKPQESLAAYGDNTWLAGAVDKISREIAHTQFRLQKVKAKGEIEVIQNHQATETLNRPQPIKGGKSMLSGMQLKLITGYHLCLAGEAFWLLDKRLRIGGAPTMVDLMLPQFVYPSIKGGELQEYVYRLPEGEIRIDPMDVVHFKLPDPSKWQRGQPPVQPIRYALDTHREADVMNLKKIQNGAVPKRANALALFDNSGLTPDELLADFQSLTSA